jgi:FMNH2-dependent dimethyl sulfone monooxygenase
VGRTVRTVINPVIVSRDTEREANEYAEAIASCRSRAHSAVTTATPMHGAGARMRRISKALGSRRQHRDRGHARSGRRATRRAENGGIDGVQLGFYDFLPDLKYFGEHILPRLKQAGLRL